MTIVKTEIITYKSENMGGVAAVNGGAISTNVAPTNTANNVFPPTTQADLAGGLTRWRKLCDKIEDSEDSLAYSVRQFVWKNTAGDDQIVITPGTWTDNEDDLSSPDLYGSGVLDSNVSAAATTLDVVVEDGAVPLFRNGDWVVVTDRTDLEDDQTGSREFIQLSADGSVSGDVVTLTFTGTPLANAYLATVTRVASCIDWGDLQAEITSVVESLSNGATFDEAAVIAHTIGARYDTITLTFSSSSAFNAAGATLGSLGGGNTGSDYAPVNPLTGTPYFTIPSSAWSGTPDPGDTVEFVLVPLGCPYWARQLVPGGSSAAASNGFDMGLYLES